MSAAEYRLRTEWAYKRYRNQLSRIREQSRGSQGDGHVHVKTSCSTLWEEQGEACKYNDGDNIKAAMQSKVKQ